MPGKLILAWRWRYGQSNDAAQHMEWHSVFAGWRFVYFSIRSARAHIFLRTEMNTSLKPRFVEGFLVRESKHIPAAFSSWQAIPRSREFVMRAGNVLLDDFLGSGFALLCPAAILLPAYS